MIVLVTGATGFIGRRLSARLSSEGFHVRATSRCAQSHREQEFEWVRVGQLDDAGVWDRALLGVNVVVHLAALAHQIGRAGEGRWEEFRRTNVEGTQTLARSCALAGVRRLVFLSSIAATGALPSSHGDPATVRDVQSDYGRSKLEAEWALQRELAGTSTDWCILRPPLVYGPGNPGNMERLFRLIRAGVPLPFGSIRNLRSFVFVDNLVDAIITVLRFPRPIRAAFAVTDGTEISTPALVMTLAKFSGRRAWLLPVPTKVLRWLARGADIVGSLTGRSLPFDSYTVDRLTRSQVVDGTRFRTELSWSPPIEPQRALEVTCRELLRKNT